MKRKNKNHKVALTIGGLIIIVALMYIFVNTHYQASVMFSGYDPIQEGVTPSGASTSSMASTGEGPESIGFSAITGAICPASHPTYCSNVGFCYEEWVDCETLDYCGDGYYGCKTGDKLIC